MLNAVFAQWIGSAPLIVVATPGLAINRMRLTTPAAGRPTPDYGTVVSDTGMAIKRKVIGRPRSWLIASCRWSAVASLISCVA